MYAYRLARLNNPDFIRMPQTNRFPMKNAGIVTDMPDAYNTEKT